MFALAVYDLRLPVSGFLYSMILAIISVTAVFVALILVHELGHFLAAKRAGMKVEEFGIFFPPRLFSVKKGETVYSLNLVPLGGFVKIFGEEGKHEKDPRSFAAQPISQRALVLSAGVLMNILLAAGFFIWGFNAGMPTAVTADNEAKLQDIGIRIIQVAPDSPAQQAGLQIGDKILSAQGTPVDKIEQLQALIKSKAGQAISLEIQRGRGALNLQVLARQNPPQGQGPIGVALARIGLEKKGFLEGLTAGIATTFQTIGAVVIGFYLVVKGLLVQGELAGDVAGPVGIVGLFFQFYQLGLPFFLRFAGLLSVSLAVINILPFPALDGGRLAFLGWEGLSGRRVPQKVEQVAHTLGYVALIVFILLVTLQDIGRF